METLGQVEKPQSGDKRAQMEATLGGCPGTNPLPLSPLGSGFHTTLHNTPNQGFLLQEPATIKKMEQQLEKKNLEEGTLQMEEKSPEKKSR